MARNNNPSVTLTFAGDSKQVTKSTDEVGDATEKLRDRIDKNSTQMSRDTETSTEKIRNSQRSQQNEYRRTGESFEDMVNRMIRDKRRLDALAKNAEALGVKEHPVFGVVFKQPAQDAGEESGDSFSKGFSSSMKTALGRLAVPAAIGGFALLTRFIGTFGLTLGGALVTGIGAGIAGIGLVVAAKSPVVLAHFERLNVNVQAKLMQISKPFEQTLIDAAATAQRVFNSFAPELDKVFPQAAKDISEFIYQLGEGFRQLAPVIAPIMDAFGKILDAIGPQLPGVFQDIANALIPLAETVGRNADGFAKIIIFMLELIPLAINLINAMIKYGEAWDKVWNQVVSAVEWAWGIISSIYGFIADGGQRIADFVGGIFGDMKESIKRRLDEVLSGARDLPSAFRAALGDLGNILWNAGSNLVQGLINGIKAKFQEVKNTLTNLTGLLPQWKGPMDVDARLLINNGRAIMDSLVVGFRQEEPEIKSYLNDLTGFIGGFGPGGAAPLAAPVASSTNAGGNTVTLRVDDTEVGRLLVSLLQDNISARGGNVQVVLGRS